MRSMVMISLVLGIAAVPALADDAAAAPPAQFGAATRAWTDLQANGSAASKTDRPLPGEAGTRVYERYLQSFAHPIPEHFDRQSFSGGSSGGSSSTR